MKTFQKTTLGVCIFLIGAIFIFSGCDQLTKVKDSVLEYFKGDKDTAASTQANPQQPAQQQKQQPKAAAMIPDTLARVGAWSITKEEFKERLDALKQVAQDFDPQDQEAKKMVLDELVRQQLFVEEAKTQGVDKDKDVLRAIDEFKRTLLVREMARKLVQNITVSDEEIKKLYDENKDSFVGGYDYRVSEIVVPTEEKAKEILDSLKSGNDFAEMAKKNSISDSAANGGDLGFLKEDPFPEMVKAILSLKQGETSDVFKGPDGYYIVKLTEKVGGEQLNFDQVKEELKQNRLLMKQQQAIMEHLDELKKKIPVEVNESLL